MNFKIGYKVKPLDIDNAGKVTFTDGINEVKVNQKTCEAYGYSYNPFTGTCSTKLKVKDVQSEISIRENKIFGAGNQIESKVSKSLINGSNNRAKGSNTNIFINGNDNTVSFGVVDAAILSGNNANAIRTGEVIIGGSRDIGLDDSSGNPTSFRTQTSKFHMTAVLNTGSTIVYPTLSGLDGIFGIPMSINSLTVLKATVIASKAGTALYHMEELTCIATCNSSGVSDVNSITKNVINTQIGNSGIGIEDGKALNIATSTTLYNENEVYVAFVNELLGGGAVSPIAVSVSVEIVEQIHDYNTNITTNI